MMGYGGSGLFGGLGMGFGMIFWIAIIGLAVWALVAVFSSRTGPTEEPPLEILKRRYARGEITQAEFEHAKNSLT